MHRYAFALALAIPFVGPGLASADDAGLPLPAWERGAPSDPEAPAPNDRSFDPLRTSPLELLGGLWRSEATGPRAGATRVKFTPTAAPGHYRYERLGDGGALVERGQATLDGTHLYTRQDKRRDGLTAGLGLGDPQAVFPQRHGFYRVREDGERARGFYYVPQRSERGGDRMSRVGPDTPNNRVDLLVDGGEFFPALREELQAAKRSICLQTFIYTGDSTGREIGEILAEKAREGVEVRLLVDAFGAKLGKDLEHKLEASGVEVIFQHGWAEALGGSFKNIGHGLWDGVKRLFGKTPKPREKRGAFNHDHRKIIVVDGRVGFIGGMNIAREYEVEWHDVHTRVEGNVVREMEDLFYDRWNAAGGKCEQRPDPDPIVTSGEWWPGSLPADVIETLPGLKREIKAQYLFEISNASRSIHIEMAYFLDDTVINALKRQAQRGVETLVIIPNDEDHDVKIVRDAFSWAQNDVIRSGVALYKYQGRMVHTKLAIFDAEVTTVGSCNLDNMALEKLAEANLLIPDAGFAQLVDQRVIQADLPQSERAEVEKMGWWNKVKGGVLHFFRSFL